MGICDGGPLGCMAGENIARAAEWHLADFNSQDFSMVLWALSRPESLNDACRLFDQARHIRVAFSPLSFGAMLMEYEQRELLEHEVVL